jgi:seryl-tRNA synthetase
MPVAEHVRLESAVPREIQEDLLKNLWWVDEGLRSLDFDPGDAGVLRFRYEGASPPESLRRRLAETAARLARSLAAFPARRIFERGATRAGGGPSAEAEMLRLGWIVPVAPGACVYRGLMSRLFHGLDREFRRLALRLGAEECRFPSTVELGTLARAGYLADFAHNARLVCHLPEHLDAIARVKGRIAERRDGSIRAADCADPEAALSPTVCYQMYRSLQGRTLAGPIMRATAVSSCFRHEGRAAAGVTRLCEFTMREIIGVGEPAAVNAMRGALLDVMKELLDRFELCARIEIASDPFFIDVYEAKRMFQVSFDLKHEVRAHLPAEDRWIAIGSVNHHQDHFGKAFGIGVAGGAAQSCCLGFGLDRWAYAIMAQHGLDAGRWPRAAARVVEEPGA